MTELKMLHGKIINSSIGSIDDGLVLIEGELISWISSVSDYVPERPEVELPQPTDELILPGLIDVHNHGSVGAGFPNTDLDGALRAISYQRRQGVTSLLASLVPTPADDLVRQASLLADLVEQGDLLGIHLEGPFLNQGRCGAQDPASSIGLEDAVIAATRTPAQLLGVGDTLGTLAIGSRADIVVIDRCLRLRQVFYRGSMEVEEC